MCRGLEAILFVGIAAMVLTTGCGPALPTAQAPITPPPSEFVPGRRLQAGTVLHYRMRGSVTGTAAGQQTPEAYQEMRATYHVLSVDSQGTASLRIDLEGKPDTFARIRKGHDPGGPRPVPGGHGPDRGMGAGWGDGRPPGPGRRCHPVSAAASAGRR